MLVIRYTKFIQISVLIKCYLKVVNNHLWILNIYFICAEILIKYQLYKKSRKTNALEHITTIHMNVCNN